VSVQIIPDGVHIHPAMLRLAARQLAGGYPGGEESGSLKLAGTRLSRPRLGRPRLILISDGMQAMGLPEGRYRYNGLDYESKDGTARYPDGTLIGTALGMSQLVACFVHHTGFSLAQAIQAASYNPACLLGLQEHKGSLAVGKDADLVLLEADLTVRMTYRNGRCVYKA
jgi:N-acetylglucosamine-6-phosphate deacetylase